MLSFAPCFQVEKIAPDQVFLFDEKKRRFQLKGLLHFELSELLQKATLSREEIVHELSSKYSYASIYYALKKLEKRGFLELVTEELSAPLRAYCSLLNIPVHEAKGKIETMSLSLQSLKPLSKNLFELQAKKMELKLSSKGALSVVLTPNYREKTLFTLAQSAKENKGFFLPIKPIGAEVWFGPLFSPSASPCFQCLLDALKISHPEETLVEKLLNKKNPITCNKADLPSLEPLAINLALNEILKWILAPSKSSLENTLFSYDILSGKLQKHTLSRSGVCSHCFLPKKESLPPFTLNPRQALKGIGSDYRKTSAEDTYRTYQHLISPITGIVSFVEAVRRDGKSNFEIYRSGHNIGDIEYLNRPSMTYFRTASGGKGKTTAQAKASCLCEAIERFSGIYRGNEPVKSATYEELTTEALHPQVLSLFSEEQYEKRDEWNQHCHHFHFVPSKLDPKKVVDWAPIWSITNASWKWIPTAAAYYSYPFKKDSDRFYRADSNGCAAGNTIEEAILQGFFELIERDCVAIWWYNRLKMPGVDLRSFNDSFIEEFLEYFSSLNREVWALDITMDISIPSFAVFSKNLSGSSEELIFGFGSHLDPLTALTRALTEMNQALDFLELRRRPNESNDLRVLKDWLKNATIKKHPYIIPSSEQPFKKSSAYPMIQFSNFAQYIDYCKNLVQAKNMELLILDQTREEIGLPVVRVVVPGLRHFWNRYDKGRLYDVPLELGLLKTPLKENQLNPIPIFI